MLKYLLDTHIAIYVIKRRPIEVLGVFNENAGRMAISAVTLSELFHGAEKSAKVAQNVGVVEEFASLLAVLPYTAKASQHYGAIRSALQRVGRPIGVNDLHIAAHARSCQRRSKSDPPSAVGDGVNLTHPGSLGHAVVGTFFCA